MEVKEATAGRIKEMSHTEDKGDKEVLLIWGLCASCRTARSVVSSLLSEADENKQ